MNLVYIDDVVDEMIAALNGNEHCNENFCEVPVTHTRRVGEIVGFFVCLREIPGIPGVEEGRRLERNSIHLPFFSGGGSVSFVFEINVDERGSFTEFIRTADRGQVAVNISKPGITKGEHWHHTKVEKFVVVSGHGLIQMRKVDSDEVVNFEVSGDKIEVVETIPGYTHNIVNLSENREIL